MNDNLRLAFSCSSYEEYSKLYDSIYGVEKKEVKPVIKRMVTIRFADGMIRSYNMMCFTLKDMISISNNGGVVLGYYDEYLS